MTKLKIGETVRYKSSQGEERTSVVKHYLTQENRIETESGDIIAIEHDIMGYELENGDTIVAVCPEIGKAKIDPLEDMRFTN